MNEAEILEMTYFDICTIKRKVKIKDEETGITSSQLKVIAGNIKCALSKKDTPLMSSDGVGKVIYSNQLFTNPNVDIQEADMLEVISMGKTTTYLASKPFPYPSHTITPVTEKERI
ncbi:hypothetical protein LZ906_006710 [Paraclostridium ghonii]|uniref:hypothetical protein n=1 Tax=Paraclostridium ghonii TaxID=29358 RepID=UPI00202CF831|nr:hypothetical protein [Paeniclostridium ghonii]MCM0166996.1 hypothetical protein [Paeniclostridium ghonii]